MPAISVIIPTFNRRQLLDITLSSILQQTLPPDEIIVVDNQSTDGTVQFLKNKYGSRIIVVSNTGRGPGSGRNVGFRLAKGEFIKFFDSDDVMTRNTLAEQHDALTESSKGFVYSPYIYACQSENENWIAKHNLILNYFPFNDTRPLWHYMMVDGLFITIPGMLFRKQLLQQVGPWREDITASEDWDFLFRISLIEPRPAHTNGCVFIYRIHGRQTTANDFLNSERDADKVIVLKDLFEKFIIKDSRFTWGEKKCFLNKLYQVYRASAPATDLHESLAPYNTLLNKILWTILRIKLRLGRTRTKTDWQPAHGPFVSKGKIDYFLKLV